MRKDYAFILVISIICAGLLPLASLVRVSFALPGARIYVDPPSNTFYSNSTGIGHRFNVTVWAENVTNSGGVQVYMDFNDTFINVTRWFEPKNDPQYLFASADGTMALPTPPNDVNYLHIGAGIGRVFVSVSLLPTEPPWINGSGKICIFEIEITAAPFVTNQLASILHINTADTYIIDGDSENESPGTTKEDGTYTYVLTPKLYLDPSENVFDANTTSLGYRFNVTVWVENVTELAAAQIYLEFNDTMINVTRWFEPKNDTEYVFYGRETTALPSPPDPKYLHISSGKGRILVSLSLFPLEPPYFSGTGKLCILEFNITSANQAMSCPLSLHNSNVTDPKRTYLLDGNGAEIPIEILEDGSYVFIPEFASFVALSLLMTSAVVVLWLRRRLTVRVGKI